MSLINATFAWLLGVLSPIVPAGAQLQPCSDVPGATVCMTDDLPVEQNRPQADGVTRATHDDEPIYNGF
ncbi:MAG: hypothetical protein H6742_15855 [Alphaproteobacteria bacterium]|nr:hypothetical protein [Alphaproteobacteria bacterium]